ncbi:MAG: YfbM family protein [Nostoc sp. NOS(2021)]|uniref:YfbM family protein n=1 Tax=Nostoc sp. NOS(2021) TaxID=2815407 RepID=UPI0025D16DBA|nr:YfbM family protein [Nostoc sp. NOS(2021)]MBN3896182.1 YfbM family protein [Nostoc sp. NOS(2021)]
MGITASYKRITPQKFAEIQNDIEAAASFFELDLDDLDFSNPQAMIAKLQERRSNKHYFRLEDWHALHFLLTGESNLDDTQTSPPLCNVVMGGTPTQFEAGYRFVRYLTLEEVRDVADALSQTSVEELKRRFNSTVFNAAEIYPNPSPGGWDEEEIETLFELYPKLVRFFQNAAKEGDIVLLSSD